MRENVLKRKLRAGEPVVGVFNDVPSPSVVEVLGLLGLDFVVMDAEHSTLMPDTAENLYRAADLRGLSTVTRIGENTPQVIQKFIDAGSQGVLVPMVNTAEQAKRVIDAVKYPPIGKRGLAGPRAADYGLGAPIADYVRMANEETLIALQIETTEAVENFEEIVALDHVDVLFFGPSDLSSTLGFPGQTRHPEVLDLIEKLTARTVALGKSAGTITRDVDDYGYWRQRGVQWMASGTNPMLARGVRGFLDDIRGFEESRAS